MSDDDDNLSILQFDLVWIYIQILELLNWKSIFSLNHVSNTVYTKL